LVRIVLLYPCMTNGTTRDKTLTETLSGLGYTYRARELGKNEILRGTEVVFRGNASETWQWLRDRGEVR